MPITTPTTAYKFGFSVALRPDTFSAHNELSTVPFEGSTNEIRIMQYHFRRGYLDGTRLRFAVCRDNAQSGRVVPVAMEVRYKTDYDRLSNEGWCVVYKPLNQ